MGGMDLHTENKIRIQKYLSDIGIMSRRAAEREIASGNITVNGIVAKLGDKIDPANDAILINNLPVSEQHKKYYILLNKPIGYITTMKDEFGRKTITELLKDIPCRIYPVGRLDAQSEGALICTNDGEFANKVIHPSFDSEKTYLVYSNTVVTDEQITFLNNLRKLDNETIRPVETKIIKKAEHYSIIEFKLHEGKNRQIRRMCEKANINIMQLKRTSVGKVSLGNLPSGKWRSLTSDEIKSFGVK